MEQIYIYGDSLLKATVPDESFRYHFHLPEVMNWYPRERVAVTNRSKMGATSTKGLQLVEHDVARGMDARYALVAYGGNDSDYDWPAVAEDPAFDHRPRTELPTFVETMRSAVKALREKGVQPVMMTLPPIDAARYLRFICRGGLSRERIMQWLGEEQMIYRHQEMYSDAGARLAFEEGVPLIGVRENFLGDHHFSDLLAADGIHLTMAGYRRLFDTLADWLRHNL